MYTAGSCKYSFEVVWCGFPDMQVRCLCLARQVLLLEPDYSANIRVLQTPSLLRLLFFDRSSCSLEFPQRKNVKEGDYPAVPFCNIGKVSGRKVRGGSSQFHHRAVQGRDGGGEVPQCIFCCPNAEPDATHRFQQVRI